MLLLDEVHLGMDVVVRRRFWDELLAMYLRERPTVVIASHQVDEIEDLLEDVVVLASCLWFPSHFLLSPSCSPSS